MSQLPHQWPAGLFRGSLKADFCKGITTATRNFHASTCQRASSGDSKEDSAPRPGRISKSQTAFSELRNLPRQTVGLRGGVFAGGPSRSTQGDRSSTSRPQGAPLIRRMTVDGPVRGGSPQGMVMARRRQPAGASARGRGNNRGAARRGNRSRRAPETKRKSMSAMDEDMLIDEDDIDDGEEGDMHDELPEDGDELSNTMVRFLREEHERIKGDKPYYPEDPQTAELLALTKKSLPPTADVTPRQRMEQHLESTTPESWDPLYMPMINKQNSGVARLIQGFPVRLPTDGKPRGHLSAEEKEGWSASAAFIKHAQADQFNNMRQREADKMRADGLKPNDEIQFAQIPDALRKKTESRVLAGKYELEPREDNADDTQRLRNTVLRGIQSNSSYMLGNKHAFMDVVENLLAGKPQGKAPKMGKT